MLFKIKRFTIRCYYDFIFWLEDVFGTIETKINDHRKRLDDKYWDKYIFKYEKFKK